MQILPKIWFITIINLLIWPLSLFLANQNLNFLHYFIPGILVGISYYFFHKKSPWYITPLLLLPLLQPKLVLIPFIFLTINLTTKQESKKMNIALLLVSIILFMIYLKPFWGQTIFIKDYEAEQAVIRQTLLYPNTWLARLSHNKLRIPLDKFNNNFFALTDPNNYFFRFHPRQITIDNQNLKKFSVLAILPIIYAIFNISKTKGKRYLVAILISSILGLSVLTNFDRHDFILWIPLSVLFIEGLNMLAVNYRKYFSIYATLLYIFPILEIGQLIIQYLS